MCADANAAMRFQAKQKWLDKNFKYKSEGNKYHNREAGYKKSLNDNVIDLVELQVTLTLKLYMLEVVP